MLSYLIKDYIQRFNLIYSLDQNTYKYYGIFQDNACYDYGEFGEGDNSDGQDSYINISSI